MTELKPHLPVWCFPPAHGLSDGLDHDLYEATQYAEGTLARYIETNIICSLKFKKKKQNTLLCMGHKFYSI